MKKSFATLLILALAVSALAEGQISYLYSIPDKRTYVVAAQPLGRLEQPFGWHRSLDISAFGGFGGGKGRLAFGGIAGSSFKIGGNASASIGWAVGWTDASNLASIRSIGPSFGLTWRL